MKLIDFDGLFQKHLEGWMRACVARGVKPDQIEEQLPEEYDRIISEPLPELGGASAVEYFQGLSDPGQLVELMREYEAAGIEAPELLSNRIGALRGAATESLIALAGDAGADQCLRVAALNLMAGLGDERSAPLCLALVDGRAEHDDLADLAAEVLQGIGESIVPQMLARLESASPESLKTYLDLLCNFPGDERIYTYTLHEFLLRTEQRALFASFLAKLGDARAIEPLSKVMAMADLNYLDYLEIANAIDMLGGDAGDRARDFSGDIYYEALKQALNNAVTG